VVAHTRRQRAGQQISTSNTGLDGVYAHQHYNLERGLLLFPVDTKLRARALLRTILSHRAVRIVGELEVYWYRYLAAATGGMDNGLVSLFGLFGYVPEQWSAFMVPARGI
jgi:hypothetical protein